MQVMKSEDQITVDIIAKIAAGKIDGKRAIKFYLAPNGH